MRTILESVARALVGNEPYERMTPYGREDAEEKARRVIQQLEYDGITLMRKLEPRRPVSADDAEALRMGGDR